MNKSTVGVASAWVSDVGAKKATNTAQMLNRDRQVEYESPCIQCEVIRVVAGGTFGNLTF